MRHVSATSSFAYTPAFDKDLADQQRNDGLLMKNARLHREELDSDRKKTVPDPKAKAGGRGGRKGKGDKEEEEDE